MKKSIVVILFIFFCTILSAFNFFSKLIKEEVVNLDNKNQSITLNYSDIIINSEKIYYNDRLLKKDEDYKINYQEGLINFLEIEGEVRITYLIYPEKLLKSYFLYEKQNLINGEEKIKINNPAKKLIYSNMELDITGNKTISISVANNKDFTLDQSLFLKINGKLSDNLYIESQLSDSESPITPEGDTRKISNLDQIFIRLYGDRYEVAFGDLETSYKSNAFIDFAPKFEGIKANWTHQNQYEGAIAISKGKKTTQTFSGVEAKQGPYYLTAESNISVQVVAGSELVYLDGEKMQRGDDYTIDYSEGSITFKNKHFISSDSFIQVTFQYSDEDYRQNMYLAQNKTHIVDNLALSNYIIIRNDDKDNPLQFTFDDEDKEILAEAGDGKAWGSGIEEVDEGSGNYIYSPADSHYIYVGYDSTGNYNITFTYVGESEGDYILSDQGDYYEYAGENGGNYLPIIDLPKPEFKGNYDMGLAYSTDFFKVNTEIIYSMYDKNTFSSENDNNNDAYAAHIETSIHPSWENFQPRLNFKYRKINRYLELFSEIEDPLTNFESTNFPDSLARDEYFISSNLNIFDFWQPCAELKYKKIKNYARFNFMKFISKQKQFYIFPNLDYQFLSWESDYFKENFDFDYTKMLKHKIGSHYIINFIKVGNEYEYQKPETKYTFENSVRTEKKIKQKYYITTYETEKIASEVFYEVNENDSLKSAEWKDISRQTTIGLKSIVSLENHNFNLSFSHRDIQYPQEQSFDLVDFNSNHDFLENLISLNTNYSIENLEFYPKTRELIEVSYGLYDSTGNLGGEGGYDWVITDIDYENPEMSIDVKFSSEVNLRPETYFDNFLEKFHAETYFLINEKSLSSRKKQIYIFNPDYTMNTELTIFGKNILRQTLWYNIIHRKLTARVKYEQDNTMDNRYQTSISRENQSEEIMLDYNYNKKTNFSIYLERRQEFDSQYNSEINAYSGEINMRNRINDDFHLDSSLILTQEEGQDVTEISNYNIKSVELKERITYYFLKKYKLFGRFSYKRNFRSGPFLDYFNEKKDGNLFKTNFTLIYEINNYSSINIEYDGKLYPDSEDIHKISLEAKAEF